MGTTPKYKRVLIKLSGHAFQGNREAGIDFEALESLALEIAQVKKLGCDIAIVNGAGNLFRGSSGAKHGMDEPVGHYIGMIATVMNALALQDALEQVGIATRVLSAIEMQKVAEPYIRRKAIRHMEKGRIVICAGGIGSPFFTTDTAGVLRAIELDCGIMIKASNIDGVYNKDPKVEKGAVKYSELSYGEVLKRNLRVLDATAISLAREKSLPIIVIDYFKKGSLKQAVEGKKIGTIIGQDKS